MPWKKRDFRHDYWAAGFQEVNESPRYTIVIEWCDEDQA
jgi:hypothetical protein